MCRMQSKNQRLSPTCLFTVHVLRSSRGPVLRVICESPSLTCPECHATHSPCAVHAAALPLEPHTAYPTSSKESRHECVSRLRDALFVRDSHAIANVDWLLSPC